MCCILQLIWLSDNRIVKELFEIMQILSYCCYNCLLHFHSNLNWNLAKTLQNLHQLLNTLATPTDKYSYVCCFYVSTTWTFESIIHYYRHLEEFNNLWKLRVAEYSFSIFTISMDLVWVGGGLVPYLFSENIQIKYFSWSCLGWLCDILCF